ncbi:PTS sugar transporter subunit IIA [Actinotalea fermentans]|uniref:PTS glucose transporter subunit IIA n=1 Tax=Actinotalea fermentans TaxID=43671 RepID=A0A511YW83_9CELL|nr:PTS glucose transporter subunit IIA [Actinotalea fermentans]KGM15096.1 PTS glucose transporter subunit IIA [Actinotalea fermentans ATCC 43279 = JCM 9966 = DSM 3133]GEN79467.1 PTS glucose transporter subunit IIA [Actinotalea fermentans]
MTLLVVRAPLPGSVVSMADVPDPVFADALVGPGLAVDPVRLAEVGAVAPIDGTVATIHPHAFVVAAPDGRAVLVHLGLDTVQLRGAGFVVHVQRGGRVRTGDVVVTWHPGEVEAGGRSPVCPVVALEAQPGALSPRADVGSTVAAGEDLFAWR